MLQLLPIQELHDRGAGVGCHFTHALHQQGLVVGVVGLGIGRFAAEENLVRQMAPARLAQQVFHHAAAGFHVPGHIPHILDDPVVGKGHPGFQAGVHAVPVHPV